MKKWMISGLWMVALTTIGCGGKFDIQREFTSAIAEKTTPIAELKPEVAAGPDAMDPQIEVCVEFTAFGQEKMMEVGSDFVAELEQCFETKGGQFPDGVFTTPNEEDIRQFCEIEGRPVFENCQATIDELEQCAGNMVDMANYAVLSGLSYGCDSVTVPPQPELSSVCQTVIQKCPGLISIEESDGGDWEEQEYEEITGDNSFPEDNQESVNWASNPGEDDLYENDEENDSDEGDEDFFGDDSDDEEDESWY